MICFDYLITAILLSLDLLANTQCHLIYSEFVLLNYFDARVACEFENVVESDLRYCSEYLFSHTKAVEDIQQTGIMLNINLDKISHISLRQVWIFTSG